MLRFMLISYQDLTYVNTISAAAETVAAAAAGGAVAAAAAVCCACRDKLSKWKEASHGVI